MGAMLAEVPSINSPRWAMRDNTGASLLRVCVVLQAVTSNSVVIRENNFKNLVTISSLLVVGIQGSCPHRPIAEIRMVMKSGREITPGNYKGLIRHITGIGSGLD
jgi:hypothetical protein